MLQINFAPFPELITNRLILRKITMNDAPAIYFLRSDERVMKFIGKEPAASIQEAEEFIQRINKAIETNESILWGICLQNNPEEVIGTICYWRLQPQNFRAELGYALHPEFWRKGFMKEAIDKVLEYGFGIMKLHSIEARINTENIASGLILEATGFVKEGHLKEEFFFRGVFSDSVIYSRLNQ